MYLVDRYKRSVMTDRRSLRSTIGDDIFSVLATAGLTPIAAAAITTLPSPISTHATFRITLANGCRIKARRMKGIAKARRFARVRRAVSYTQLPTIIAAEGKIVVEEWIEGTPLSELQLSCERLEQAAKILGELHATTSLEGRSLLRSRSTEAIRRRVERQLQSVRDRGAITEAEQEHLLNMVDTFAPERAVVGLTHNDLCAENLVEDEDGHLYAIDNEHMKLDFLDFDLARTWYRWALPKQAWGTFLSRYGKWSSLPSSESEPFWRIAAIAKSADLRTAKRISNSDVPLDKLREILAVTPTKRRMP